MERSSRLLANGGIPAALDQNLRLHSIGIAIRLNPLAQQAAAILTGSAKASKIDMHTYGKYYVFRLYIYLSIYLPI